MFTGVFHKTSKVATREIYQLIEGIFSSKERVVKSFALGVTPGFFYGRERDEVRGRGGFGV